MDMNYENSGMTAVEGLQNENFTTHSRSSVIKWPVCRVNKNIEGRLSY